MDKPPKRIAKTNAEKAMLTVDSVLVNLWSTACNNKNVGGIEGSVKLHPHGHDLTPWDDSESPAEKMSCCKSA